MLQRIGIKRIPAISRGMDYVMGQKLKDVCDFVGIPLGDIKEFSVDELAAKMEIILTAAISYMQEMKNDDLEPKLPNRDRKIRQLCYHVYRIVEAFCELMDQQVDEYHTTIADIAHPENIKTGTDLAAYGASVLKRFKSWHLSYGGDGTEPAAAYWGEVTLRELLERVTWHPGQHVRQLKMYLENRGNPPSNPIDETVFDGLPMPKKIWDDEPMDETNGTMQAK